MAVDIASTVTYLKDHAVEHGFHVHDERHFVETYTLRQAWEIDVHPADACSGPLDLHISLDVDPRLLLRFEDLLNENPEVPEDPNGEYVVTFYFNWALPQMKPGTGPHRAVCRARRHGRHRSPHRGEVSPVDGCAF